MKQLVKNTLTKINECQILGNYDAMLEHLVNEIKKPTYEEIMFRKELGVLPPEEQRDIDVVF